MATFRVLSTDLCRLLCMSFISFKAVTYVASSFDIQIQPRPVWLQGWKHKAGYWIVKYAQIVSIAEQGSDWSIEKERLKSENIVMTDSTPLNCFVISSAPSKLRSPEPSKSCSMLQAGKMRRGIISRQLRVHTHESLSVSGGDETMECMGGAKPNSSKRN